MRPVKRNYPINYPELDPNGRAAGYEFVVPKDAPKAWFEQAAGTADGWAAEHGRKNIGYAVFPMDAGDYLVFLTERIPLKVRLMGKLARAPRAAVETVVGGLGAVGFVVVGFGAFSLAIMALTWAFIGARHLLGF